MRLKILQYLFYLISIFIFIQSKHLKDDLENPLVVLIVPSVSEIQKDEIISEANEWMEFRSQEGYEFEIIGVHEILGKDSVDYEEINNLEPEQIRSYLQNVYSEEINLNPDRTRYLGILADRPRMYYLLNTDYLELGNNSIEYSGDLTLEFFFESSPVDQFGSIFDTLYSSCYECNKLNGLKISINEKNELEIYLNGFKKKLNITSNGWNHIAITSNNFQKKSNVFLNGVKTTQISSAVTFLNSQPFYVGGSVGGGYQYSGKIDEFRISNKVIYQSNFEVDPSSIVPLESTMAIWNFESIDHIEIDGELKSIIPDVSGNEKYLLLNTAEISTQTDLSGYYLNLQPDIMEQFDKSYDYPQIKRYQLSSKINYLVPSDYPFGIVNYTGKFDSNQKLEEMEIDLEDNAFTVFRIPVNFKGDLTKYLNRSLEYIESSYQKDLLLVAGEFGKEGDTSFVQCLNEKHVSNFASNITKVFDSNICEPSYVSENNEKNLFDFLINPNTENFFEGGVIFDVSHGSNIGINFMYNDLNYTNLKYEDIELLNQNKLNVFISLACDNDSDHQNLKYKEGFSKKLYKFNGVANISSSSEVYLESMADVKFGELDILPLLFIEGYTLGESLNLIKFNYFEYYKNREGYEHYISNLFSFNMYGDPLIYLK